VAVNAGGLLTVLITYPGLCPSNVNKDAKYSVVHSPTVSMKIRLVYRVSNREKELLTTDRHDELVDMVNKVKLELTGWSGGAFYINEYRDVLVPDTINGGSVYAGNYTRDLEFDYNGTLITPRAPQGLDPGDPWPGPHVGIRYTLIAGGGDIRYELKSGSTIYERCLSEDVGPRRANELARRIATIKGNSGGRFYINEACEMFTPLGGEEGGVEYLYLGPLEDSAWFHAPDVDRGDD
jgi:hypothetical protein